MSGKLRLRNSLWLLTIFLLTSVHLAEAQRPKKIPRIGFLANAGPETPSIEPFRQGLRDLGYTEGKNILIEYRYLEGKRDRIPGLLAELVQINVDVLILGTPPAIRAASKQSRPSPL